MKCYFQGCENQGVTKEHIPPRCVFPHGEKEQLLTVKSCTAHNNDKNTDDMYVLAQICMNASPSNRAREVFLDKVEPQLSHNNGALRRTLSEGAVELANGAVEYRVDRNRFDRFFTALSCGIIFKTCSAQLPSNYVVHHQYPSFNSKNANSSSLGVLRAFDQLIGGEPIGVLDFGKPNTKNERIYSVKVFGVPGFASSITVVHLFYGTFKVVSLLTNFMHPKS